MICVFRINSDQPVEIKALTDITDHIVDNILF